MDYLQTEQRGPPAKDGPGKLLGGAKAQQPVPLEFSAARRCTFEWRRPYRK